MSRNRAIVKNKYYTPRPVMVKQGVAGQISQAVIMGAMMFPAHPSVDRPLLSKLSTLCNELSLLDPVKCKKQYIKVSEKLSEVKQRLISCGYVFSSDDSNDHFGVYHPDHYAGLPVFHYKINSNDQEQPLQDEQMPVQTEEVQAVQEEDQAIQSDDEHAATVTLRANPGSSS